MDKKERKEHQEAVKAEVTRITGLSQSACYGLAGKWLKAYGPTQTKSILSQIPDGKSVAYCEGTFRLEIAKHRSLGTDGVLVNLTNRWSGV